MISTKFEAPSLKYEIRNNKLQTNSKFKIQNSKQLRFYDLENLDLLRVSDFGFRIFIVQGGEL